MGLPPGTRLGSYEILGSLGAGGMGEVYRARDTKLKRDVAIKVLPQNTAADPERRARFERTLANVQKREPDWSALPSGVTRPDSDARKAVSMPLVTANSRSPVNIDANGDRSDGRSERR